MQKKAGEATKKEMIQELLSDLDELINKEDAKEQEVMDLARMLPNINQLVHYPIVDPKSKDFRKKGNYRNTLHSIVIDLNDDEGWSRQEIADWLDELHDEGVLDLSFNNKEESI